MPEGHTTHRFAGRHNELFAGKVVSADSPQGRFEGGAARITGSKLESAEAYGKHLLHHYSSGLTLHVHLGLYGKFADGKMPLPAPVGLLRLRLWTKKHWVELRGPNTCELIEAPEVAMLIGRLGADPIRGDGDPTAAYSRISRSNTALASLLMDQSIVAGVGLIFALEALYRAGLPPTLPGRQLTPQAWQGIWADLETLMRQAVSTGRIDTVRPEQMPEAMGRPPREDRHGGEVYVYRRAGLPCLVCGTAVARGELGGRNLYWCPRCQP
jgi:endonuclease-8